ncbi:YfjL-like protein [Paenibacillus segetis]|uniref:YfjL-like N-terminal domain-containing protein n=1 Tax=Paenibacillus segetis TaxID=1325360 RepID=A0ABQ1YCI7_9BACL|nr:hypothetical protein [Paenibacillus segetis]GGH19585.1 hypothetical protein GCM10008013_16380 [Paenibacillus segetis]
MRKIRIQYIVLFLIFILFGSVAFFFYTEINGYPWKHAEVKREAVTYMKEKYNMDVKVVGSSFNFKFDYYTAQVYNTKDSNKTVIRIEKQRFYDENNQAGGEQLEDNYREVYWEKEINDELHQKYSTFYKLNDIETSTIDIPSFTSPLRNGVSSLQDRNGVFIPSAPEYNYILDVDLKTNDFTEELLQELIFVIRDLVNTEFRVDIVVSGKYEVSDTEGERRRTKYLDLPYEKLKEIENVEDLKKEISEY